MTAELLPHFTFLRPLWLIGLLPVLTLCWLLYRQARGRSGWESIIPGRWQPMLLDGSLARAPGPFLLLALGLSIATIALAGPAVRSAVHLAEQNQSSVVVVLDLSRNMLAGDLSPTRLTRAQRKIQDLLARPEGYQVGLVAYAGSAHRVTPISDDYVTLANLLGVLEPGLMPSQGNDVDAALSLAHGMVKDLPRRTSAVLLVTSGVEGDALEALERHAAVLGPRLAILGVGTAAGAPVALAEGGFMRDSAGRILLPRLDEQSLSAVARRHGAGYHGITQDDSDLDRLLGRLESTLTSSADQQVVLRDIGHWLLLPLALLAALALRRGWLGVVLVCALLPAPAEAGWADLWRRGDQQAMDLLADQRPEDAARRFQDPAWRSWALFEAGQFEEALKGYAQVLEQNPNDADNHYNYGTLLALAGRYEESLEAFEQALTRQPDHQRARHNRAQVEALLESLAEQAAEATEDDESETNPDEGSNGEAATGEAAASDPAAGDPAAGDQATGDMAGAPSDETAQGAESSAESAAAQDGSALAADDGGEISSQAAEPRAGTSDEAAADLPMDREQRQALQQWLQDIPDDPGELLRRKFLHQHLQRRESPP